MQDDKQRNIVHYRWVDECIRQQEILMHHEQLHLVPLPHKAPNLNFASILQPAFQRQLGIPENELHNGSIAFTLVTDQVFESLAELYGIQNKFKDGVTKYIVCVSEDKLECS